MDKMAKAYGELFKQVYQSPLEEAFKKWRETTKQIKKEREQNEK
jgi:hypothetical protein|tara:strand:+ start:490 stop:621 length:132 start_codon:yes stop_codon:yes gene_type:complete